MHRYTVYLENAKYETVRHAETWLGMQWLAFWIGLKSFFPDPRKAQRVVIESPGWDFQSFLHD